MPDLNIIQGDLENFSHKLRDLSTKVGGFIASPSDLRKVASATFSDASRVSSGSMPKFFTRMGVFVLSGLMQLMRMPSASHSCATACTKLTMAALVDE